MSRQHDEDTTMSEEHTGGAQSKVVVFGGRAPAESDLSTFCRHVALTGSDGRTYKPYAVNILRRSAGADFSYLQIVDN